jgi:LPS O-antigen subunit length determinant protein (WzzB/FepE family)
LIGTKFISADIEYLKSLNNDISLGEENLTFKKEIRLLKKNRFLDQLNVELMADNDLESLLFYDTQPNAQAVPEKSKQLLITIVGILLGRINGLFIATERITFRSYKDKT